MKNLLSFLTLSLMVALFSQAAPSTTAPNVVFVITDDQGYGDLSVTGNPIIKTPAIDQLHGESVRLTDYHVSPTCAPTRGALMSGHYTNRAGPWHTIRGRSFLRQTSTTWGDVFSAGGYATGMFGKWHLGDNYPYRPEDRGFQEVVRHGGGGVGQTPDYWNNSYFDDTYFHNGVPQKYEGYCTDIYFNEAKRFITQSVDAGKPFLAYISTNAPHGPFLCPDKYWKPYMDQGISQKEAIFYGMIANVDENVGAMRDWLKDQGLAENTIFIFTTDNGTASGGQIYNASMRGFKNSEYDGGHRVPFFLTWPAAGLTKPRDVEPVTAHIDILPTFIELCGLPLPRDYAFDGRSLAPLLFDQPTPWVDRTVITDSQRVIDPIMWRKSAVMTNEWRLVNGTELYKIKEDPAQEKDLAGKFPQQVQILRKEYEDWWASISPGFVIHERVVVGNDAENPLQLTGHDWLAGSDNDSPWHQGKIRAAKLSVGKWAIRVDQNARYEISLRRWPRELSRAINADLAPGDAVPGMASPRETPGRPIEAKTATLQVGDYTETKPVLADAEAVTFVVELKQGEHFLEGIFHTGKSGEGQLGSFYAVIERL